MIGAVDIGGTKIAGGIVDDQGRVVASMESPTEPAGGFSHALDRMCDMLRRCSQESGVEITGIGIGCTGPVDPFAGTIGDVPFLPGWQGSTASFTVVWTRHIRRLGTIFSIYLGRLVRAAFTVAGNRWQLDQPWSIGYRRMRRPATNEGQISLPNKSANSRSRETKWPAGPWNARRSTSVLAWPI